MASDNTAIPKFKQFMHESWDGDWVRYEDHAAEVEALRARLASIEPVYEACERIKNEAHLRGDAYAYDLMRTVLDAAREAEGSDGR